MSLIWRTNAAVSPLRFSASERSVRATIMPMASLAIPSGMPARSARGMMCDRTCMRASGAALGGHREERARAFLVAAVGLAARAQHVLLQRRDAGDVPQEPVHARRSRQRE